MCTKFGNKLTCRETESVKKDHHNAQINHDNSKNQNYDEKRIICNATNAFSSVIKRENKAHAHNIKNQEDLAWERELFY